MDKESLIKAKEILINSIGNSKIKPEDRAELLMNIFLLLNDYDNSIKSLQSYQYKKKHSH